MRVPEGESEEEGLPKEENEVEEEGQLEGAVDPVAPAVRVDVLLIVYVCVEVPLNECVTVTDVVGDTEEEAVEVPHTEAVPDTDREMLAEADVLGHAD